MRRLALLLLLAAPAFAGIGDTYVIPAAGHVTGANGEVWLTDVMLHNVNDATLTVELTGVSADGTTLDTTPATVTVPAHGTVALHDVLPSAAPGALVLAGDAPFTATSRVYTENARGSVGQSIAAMNDFADAASPDAFLTGLVANARYRTNVGFFAAANATDLTVEVTLMDSAGVTLGTRTLTIGAGRLAHVQVSSRDIAPASFDTATARVRVISGDGLVSAYACVIDNASSDGAFIPGIVRGGGINTKALRQLIGR